MMKKLIFLLVVAASFSSCKKDKGQCYNCSYGTINGYQKPDDTFCGDINNYHPTDAQGNQWQYFCTPK